MPVALGWIIVLLRCAPEHEHDGFAWGLMLAGELFHIRSVATSWNGSCPDCLLERMSPILRYGAVKRAMVMRTLLRACQHTALSVAQACFVRDLRRHGHILGSYPLFVQAFPYNWSCGDIDVWVMTSSQALRVIDIYRQRMLPFARWISQRNTFMRIREWSYNLNGRVHAIRLATLAQNIARFATRTGNVGGPLL